jgi:hypothetical protein
LKFAIRNESPAEDPKRAIRDAERDIPPNTAAIALVHRKLMANIVAGLSIALPRGVRENPIVSKV